MNDLTSLAQKFGISKALMQEALTHDSFYENKNDNTGNSRLVFAGMFVFKGLVADILFKYFQGTGTQLQHTLGNLFRNEYLHQLFDQWRLIKNIRASEKFDILKHKHIFVYAVFGCITEQNDIQKERFIFRYILNKANNFVLQHKTKNRNVMYQTNMLAKLIFNKPILITIAKQDDNKHLATISLKNGDVLSKAKSKSYKYARTKALKLALQVLSEINMQNFVNNSDYLERVRQRVALQNEQKMKLMLQKQQEKEELRKIRKEKLRKLKAAKNAARRKTQAEAKKRRLERAALLEAQKAKEAKPMSTKKRRYLEDKKK